MEEVREVKIMREKCTFCHFFSVVEEVVEERRKRQGTGDKQNKGYVKCVERDRRRHTDGSHASGLERAAS